MGQKFKKIIWRRGNEIKRGSEIVVIQCKPDAIKNLLNLLPVLSQKKNRCRCHGFFFHWQKGNLFHGKKDKRQTNIYTQLVFSLNIILLTRLAYDRHLLLLRSSKISSLSVECLISFFLFIQLDTLSERKNFYISSGLNLNFSISECEHSHGGSNKI